ncbi:MAG: sulfurtransferase complex subunit TusC [Psychromonas sp.]|nr:sulfurtransferase complex subunit TusC [Psychromonas sp.]
MPEKKVALVNRKASYGSTDGRESLDALLALATFNNSLSVFFIGDGIYQLIKNQLPRLILQKNYQPVFKLLDLYDVKNIYVCEDSLKRRNISENDLIIKVAMLSNKELKQHLAQQDQLLGF